MEVGFCLISIPTLALMRTSRSLRMVLWYLAACKRGEFARSSGACIRGVMAKDSHLPSGIIPVESDNQFFIGYLEQK